MSDTYELWHLSEVKSLSCVQLFATPWTVAHQAPPSMGFSRQEYWSGLPFPSPGDLPDPGIELKSPSLQADALTSEPPGKPEGLIEMHRKNFINWTIGIWGRRVVQALTLRHDKAPLSLDVSIFVGHFHLFKACGHTLHSCQHFWNFNTLL